jgi:chaperonin GroEL (HSP60 family)
MAKQIAYNHEGRQALKKGIDGLADAVKLTLGCQGNGAVE